MKHKNILTLLLVLLLGIPLLRAQTTPVQITNATQNRNGKEYYVYVAQPGQTVFSIARAYGLHYSLAVLRTDVQSMAPGDTVWLPVNAQSRAVVAKMCGAATAVVPTRDVVVEQGQTLYGISRQYGTTIEEIQELNPDIKSEGLKIGQTIKVPQQPNGTDFKAKPVLTKTPTQPVKQPVSLSIRDRISPDEVHVTLMIPLHLDKLGEISTTKFDIDQRGKKKYDVFEYVQFYEGVEMALKKLESRGVKVVLNVVDVNSEKASDVAEEFKLHNVAQSDFIIALLPRVAFDKVAELAKQNRVFVISPLAARDEILEDNPYVVKYVPSDAAVVESMLSVVAANYPGTNLYVIHSKSRNEAHIYNEFQRQLSARNDIKFTFFDWSQNGKLASALKSTRDNVVISIYDQGREKNRILSNLLLNRLNSIPNFPPMLMTDANYIVDIPDVDYKQLQNLNYHMVYSVYLDYNNPIHKEFLDSFKDHYKTEVQDVYAGIAHDIMLYFTTAIAQCGTQFWKNPVLPSPSGMLFPLRIMQKTPGSGFENQGAVIYKMDNYKLVKVR